MKNLGNQILAELKDGYKQCQNCGKIIKIKSKTCPPKYCEECAYKIKLVQNNSYYHEKDNI